jgi:hypothetical protein
MEYTMNLNSVEKLAEEGDSPVRENSIRNCYLHPSSTEHEEFRMNQRGPNHVRLNTLTNR